MAIPVVIVESHQHVLEHIHYVLRRRSRKCPRADNDNWSLFHFDAHPDMACPQYVPAGACFRPRQKHCTEDNNEGKDLYELLDTTSTGVAEWIMPLIFGTGLRVVHWFHRTDQRVSQFPDGLHSFNVGAFVPATTLPRPTVETFLDLPDTARLSVDWNCRYYADDESYASTHELKLPQAVRLVVNGYDADITASMDSPWILDICLDYFYCCNPYIVDLENVDGDFTEALTNAVLSATMYQSHAASFSATTSFHTLVKNLLQCLLRNTKSSLNDLTISLHAYYTDEATCQAVIQPLIETFAASSARSNDLAQMAIEALPHLAMPHDKCDDVLNFATARVRAWAEQLQRWWTTPQGQRHAKVRPMLITIARSVADGFTPVAVGDALEDLVIDALARVFGTSETSSPGNSLSIIRDYGQWEGTSLDEINFV